MSSVYRTTLPSWMRMMRECPTMTLRRYSLPIRHNRLNRSKKVISGFLKPMAADLKSRYIALKDGQVMSEISKAKAQEETPERLRARAKALGTKGEILSIIADVSRLQYRRRRVQWLIFLTMVDGPRSINNTRKHYDQQTLSILTIC